jgi:hypothetical protein
MPRYRFLEADRKFKNGFAYKTFLRPDAKQVLKCLIIAEIKPVYVLTIYRIGDIVQERAEQGCLFKKWLFYFIQKVLCLPDTKKYLYQMVTHRVYLP